MGREVSVVLMCPEAGSRGQGTSTEAQAGLEGPGDSGKTWLSRKTGASRVPAEVSTAKLPEHRDQWRLEALRVPGSFEGRVSEAHRTLPAVPRK